MTVSPRTEVNLEQTWHILPLAQLDRAKDFYSLGWRFDSVRADQIKRGNMKLSEIIKRLQWLHDTIGDVTIYRSFFDWNKHE